MGNQEQKSKLNLRSQSQSTVELGLYLYECNIHTLYKSKLGLLLFFVTVNSTCHLTGGHIPLILMVWLIWYTWHGTFNVAFSSLSPSTSPFLLSPYTPAPSVTPHVTLLQCWIVSSLISLTVWFGVGLIPNLITYSLLWFHPPSSTVSCRCHSQIVFHHPIRFQVGYRIHNQCFKWEKIWHRNSLGCEQSYRDKLCWCSV